MSRSNSERAARAQQALDLYDDEAVDLLADLMHLIGRDEFFEIVGRAEMHFEAEIDEDEAEGGAQ